MKTYEYNRVPYNYEEGARESYPYLSAGEVVNLVGLITRSGRIIEPAITNLHQDSAQKKARLESERTKQQEKEQESTEQKENQRRRREERKMRYSRQ